MPHTLALLAFGLAIGVVSGLLGIGGGVLLIPGLMLLFGFSQPEAQGTSLAVLALPIVLFAAVVYYQNGYVRPSVVGLIAAGFAVGAYLGAHLVPHVPSWLLRVTFGALLLYVGFLFVLTPAVGRSAAALPAGLAALVTWVFGIVLRRRRQPTPGGDEVEYHI
jgi:uncharacterized protein